MSPLELWGTISPWNLQPIRYDGDTVVRMATALGLPSEPLVVDALRLGFGAADDDYSTIRKVLGTVAARLTVGRRVIWEGPVSMIETFGLAQTSPVDQAERAELGLSPHCLDADGFTLEFYRYAGETPLPGGITLKHLVVIAAGS